MFSPLFQQHSFMDRDFSAYRSGSHIRTHSQCQKVCIFPNFDEKIPNFDEKIPKLDHVSVNISK